MAPIDYSDVLKKLSKAGVRFTVVGGFAAIAHGVVRVTMDLDLAIILDHEELTKCWLTLAKLNFKPRQPITEKEFTSLESLKRLSKEKGVKAISFYNAYQPYLVVDLLFEDQFQFRDSEVIEMELFGCKCNVVIIEKLIELKLAAGRPKDLEDINELKIKKNKS